MVAITSDEVKLPKDSKVVQKLPSRGQDVTLTIGAIINLSAAAYKSLGKPSRVSLLFDEEQRVITVGTAVKPEGYSIGTSNVIRGTGDLRRKLLAMSAPYYLKIYGKNCGNCLEFRLDEAIQYQPGKFSA